MVSYGACILGKYPRSDLSGEAAKKYQASPSEENGDALEGAYRDDSRLLIRLQKEAQMSPIVDGSLPWDDFLKPYTENLEGVKVGGIERWYETNTFYFTPIITERVKGNGPILPKYTRIDDLKASQRPWAVTIISPYTFAHLSKNLHYSATDELMFDIAAAQAEDLRTLAEAGCSQVYVFDPEPVVRESLGLHQSGDEIDQWKEAIRTLLKKSGMQSGLFLAYGNASGILADLMDFPVDYLGFDLARTPAESLGQLKFTKGLMLGALYSDISLQEDLLREEPSKIAGSIQSIAESIESSDMIYVTPNHELSTVTTRTEADRRLGNLGQAVRILKGAG